MPLICWPSFLDVLEYKYCVAQMALENVLSSWQASEAPEAASNLSEGESASASNGNGATSSAPESSPKPVRASMERKLNEALQPKSLTILDESSQHAGHAGSRMLASPSGETHFKVSVVSSAFEGLNTVKRHRLVYKVS